MSKERAAFFSQCEQDIILKTFEEYRGIIMAKGNTAAASRSRLEAWQKIAATLNAANPNNVRRTWQQVKNKYKNIVQCANRKQKQKQTLGDELTGFTPTEEVALWQIRGRPQMGGITLSLSPDHAGTSVPNLQVAEPESSGSQILPEIKCLEDTFDGSDIDPDKKDIVLCSPQEEGSDTCATQEEPGLPGSADRESDEDVTSLYKRYLRQEIVYRQLKMRKLEKEIQLLDKQLLTS